MDFCANIVNCVIKVNFYLAIVKYANLVKHQEIWSRNVICDNPH